MKKGLNIMMAVGLLATSASAQNEIDVLRFSSHNFTSTARSTAMGGAFGALGADFSSLSNNPAGLGLYRGNELTLTPQIFSSNIQSEYYNKSTKESKLGFNFANAGLVFNIKPSNANSDWKGFNFGFGYNRLNDFRTRMRTSADNLTGSLTDQFVSDARGNSPGNLDAFTTLPAFNLYLIDTVAGSDGKEYYSFFSNEPINVGKVVDSEGSMGETDLSFGANYKERLFIGASVAFQKIRYAEEARYEESEVGDSVFFLNSYSLTDLHTTKGSGVGLKFGLIFKATDWVRIGGSVHSPTYYSLEDNFRSEITALYDNGEDFTESSPEGKFNYNLRTPMRAIGSIAFIIGKKGLISGEYEYVDYSDAGLSSSSYSFANENDAVINKYRSTSNIRAGAEYRYEQWSFRGGYALYGNPFQSSVNSNAARTSYSGGIGYREGSVFIDLAYVNTQWKEKYWIYNPQLVNSVEQKMDNSSFLLTLGVKF